MPYYQVWYRNNPQPLEFSSAARVRDEEIVARILEHEGIGAADATEGTGATGVTDGQPPTLGALIQAHGLAPVRYAEDEGEPYTIE